MYSNNPSEDDVKKELLRKIKESTEKFPPTVGVIGVSGTGKSSTLNSMFKLNLTTSASVRCTTEFLSTNIKLDVKHGLAAGNVAELRVIDAPGLGEDLSQDSVYLSMYENTLDKCDVIIWVMAARNRAVALDQMYLKKLSRFHNKIVFGINQVDLLEPLNWNAKHNLPSDQQKQYVQEIIDDRRNRIRPHFSEPISITAYSAQMHFMLINLYDAVIDKCPDDRRWLFELFRATSAEAWLERASGLTASEKQGILRKYTKK